MPLYASAPYNAEAGPGITSTLCTSSSFRPIKLPIANPKSGDILFIPSTRVTKPSL